MIVLDTSAVMALALSEPDADKFGAVIAVSASTLFPTSCYVEAVMVMRRRGKGRSWLDDFLATQDVALFGSDERQARLAADAFERYGRGSGHPARLNFGDCLVYAAAKALDAPLLFKGGDFRATDITAALQA
ncbi:MAG: type II toxin-antitoxin system VapC family toxin [Methylobacteriaceae bacterium]|nr:type II toxin-antitoxin system VapC family toxin [Methylobacteriaceae bacterium]